MYCLISWEFLSDRVTYKDLSLNSYYGFLLEEKKKFSSTKHTCVNLVLEEFKMLLSPEVSLLKEKEKREKTSPLKYLFFWKQQPRAILLAHLPADTAFSQRQLKTGQNPMAAPTAKENAVFARLEPELTQVNPEASL